MNEEMTNSGSPSAGNQVENRAPKSRRNLQIIGLALLFLALLLGFYGVVAYVGLRSGQTLRGERMEAELEAELSQQMSLARDDIENDRLPLAMRRLEWVLERVPDDPEAQLLLQTAEDRLNEKLTPAATATAVPTAAPTGASATQTPDLSSDLGTMEQLVGEEAWPEAITMITEFQANYPDYRRRATDELLYDAYLNYGVDLLYTDRIELGLFYLSQAQRLGDLPEEVRDQISHAETYLQGRAFYGADWGLAIAYFRDLCLVAPFFHDSCSKLYDALVSYADIYATAQDWCPAESYYQEARRYGSSDYLLNQLQAATEGCQMATPTPLPTPEGGITDTVPITGTSPITTTLPNNTVP